MNPLARRILRIGLGITFVLIGAAVWRAPEAWGGFIQPWALRFIPGDLTAVMKQTAVLDLVVGIWLLSGWRVYIPAFIGSIHLLIVLITTSAGIFSLVERDVGLLAATLALCIETAPVALKQN